MQKCDYYKYDTFAEDKSRATRSVRTGLGTSKLDLVLLFSTTT